MMSPLLLIAVALLSMNGTQGYVAGPHPIYEVQKPSGSSNNGLIPQDGNNVVENQQPTFEVRTPLQSPVVIASQTFPVGPPRPPQSRPIRTRFRKPLDRNSMIHFPMRDEKYARRKRQTVPGRGSRGPFPQNFPRPGGRQNFFNNQQNNFGNNFDYPNDPQQWGNGNANQNPSNWQNFNGRPQQQQNFANNDYDALPLVFDNGPQRPRPQGQRPPVGNVNNRPRPMQNNQQRPVLNVQQQQFPPTMRPPVTPAPVTPASVTIAPWMQPTASPSGATFPTMGTTARGCVCPTTPEFNPVCGQDRVTYFNAGRLRCANYCGYRVEMLHDGACISLGGFTTAAP